MEPKNRFLVYMWLSALLFSACDFFLDRDPPGPPPEKPYRAEILWEREINYRYVYGSPLIEGPYCYLPAYENYPGGGENIVKVNMETGRVEWESRGIHDHSPVKPHKIGSHIYQPSYSGFIFVYNDSDGKLAATVRLGEDATEANNNAITFHCPAAVSGTYLFWGNNPNLSHLNGLMRLNSEKIDFSKVPGEIQTITPELIWSNSWQARIDVDIIPENGILYFLTSSYMSENPCVLAALDTETGGVIWEREAPHCQGFNDSSLVLNGEKLLVVEGIDNEGVINEGTFSSYDKSTGVPVLENISMGSGTGSFWRDSITLYNNRLFYSYNWNLVSADADTGTLIWRVPSWRIFPWDDEIFHSSPFVNNGKVFIMHNTGLRVYNADTGEFIGVDGAFREELWLYNEIAIYNDVYVFFHDRLGYVIAIRCK